MSIFSAISEGMRDQKEFRHGQRQQMAEAFADYKAANPYATAADFQSFIDSYSGGNNYISGGAPSASVRNRIAADNLRKKKEEEYNTAIANMIKKKEVTDMFGSEINEFLLGSGGNIEKALKDFYKKFPEFSTLDFENVEGEFNMEKYNRLKSELFAKNYPNAMTFINNATDPSNLSSDDFARSYNLDPSMAKEILAQAKLKWDEELEVKKTDFDGKVNRRVQELATDPSITPENLLATLEAEFGRNKLWMGADKKWIDGVVKQGNLELKRQSDLRYKTAYDEALAEANRLEGLYNRPNTDPKEIEAQLRNMFKGTEFYERLFADRDWLDSVIKRAEATIETDTGNRRDAAKQTALNLARTILATGDDPTKVLAEVRASLPEEFKDILGVGTSDVPEALVKMIDEAQKKYDLKVDAKRSDELGKVETKLWTPTVEENLVAQLRTGGMEAASEYISDTLSSTLTGEYWLSEEGIAEKDAFIQEHLAGLIRRNQDLMDNQITDGILTSKDREKQLLATAVSDNAQKASEIFTGDASKILSGGNPYLQEITPQLAKDWLMNDNTKNLLLTFATSEALKLAGDVTPSELKNMADAWLRTHGATPWADAVESLSTDELVQQRTLFTDYKDSVEAHISETIDSFESSFNEIQQDSKEFETAEQYESAIRVLNNLKGQYRKWVGEYGNILENNFETRRNWRDIAGKPYDRDAIDELYAGASSYLSDNTAIDRLIDRLKTEKERIQPTDLNNEERNQDWYAQYYDDTKSVDWNNKNKKRIEVKFDLDMGQLRAGKALGADLPFVGNKIEEWLRGRIGKDGMNLRDLLLGSEDAENREQIAQRQLLDKMTDDIGVKAYFRRNPEVFQAFVEDPFKAIEEVPELASMAITFGYQPPK